MSTEFILVTFPELRDVLTDGNVVGKTNRTILLPADEYVVSLSGAGYAPPERDVVVAGTSMQDPMVVAFSSTKASLPRATSARAPLTKATPRKPKPKKVPAKTKKAAKKAVSRPAAGRRVKKN